MGDARRIYQDVLDHLTVCLLARDVAGFLIHIGEPFTTRTLDKTHVCHTHADAENGLLHYADVLRDQGITDLVRTCDTAHFMTPDRISGYHTTRVLRGASHWVDPYFTRMTLERADHGWVVSLSDNTLKSADWPIMPPTHSDQTANPETSEDLHLLQHLLDRISAVYLGGDLQGWLRICALPYHMVTRHGVETYTTEDEVRRDFDLYQQEFAIHGVTDIIRQARTAERIEGDQLVGTYRTHIMRNATPVVPAWDASMTLRRENGTWRVTSIMRALGHLNWSARDAADIQTIPNTTLRKGDHQ